MIARSTSNSHILRNGVAASTLMMALSACAPFSFGGSPATAATAAPETKLAAPGGNSSGGTPIIPVKTASAQTATPQADLDSAISQAQAARKSGDFPGAIKILSQLVLYAPDDPRVLGEYGKTLVAQGRSDDALAFLERAIQLQPGDWTLYSAQGVAYDQKGNYDAARASYGRALTLKPGEASVLNNAALSRMQAGDLANAEKLLREAKAAGSTDPRIDQNLALVESVKSTQSSAAAPQPTASPVASPTAVAAAPQAADSSPTAVTPSPVVAPSPAPAVAEAPRTPPATAARPTIEPAPKPVAEAPKVAAAQSAKPVSVAATARPPKEKPPVVQAKTETPKTAEPKTDKLAEAKAAAAKPQPVVAKSGNGHVFTYYVQAGAYSSEDRAQKMATSLDRFGARVSPATVDGRSIFRVRIGPFIDREQANVAIGNAQSLGYTDVKIVAE